MKKLMTLAMALSFLTGSVAVAFGDDAATTTTKTTKAKVTKATKATKTKKPMAAKTTA
jgi:hypothetical protein